MVIIVNDFINQFGMNRQVDKLTGRTTEPFVVR